MTISKADKPLCYSCEYKGNVPGSCHSSCQHPATIAIQENPLAQLVGIIGRCGPMPCPDLNIKANKHGIRNGWFAWPMNFDPTWLENCDGYKAK